MRLHNRYRVEQYHYYGFNPYYVTTQFKWLAIFFAKFAPYFEMLKDYQYVVVADYYSYKFPELGRIEISERIWE